MERRSGHGTSGPPSAKTATLLMTDDIAPEQVIPFTIAEALAR
jgi:hypothetical protein